MNEDYFVSIADPVFLEKSLLSDVKASIEFSIINQKIQDIKIKKATLFNTLKSDLDSISALLTELDEKLPHKDLLIPEKPKPVSKSSTSKKKAAVKKVSTSISKLDKLNHSLAEIERRLKDLS
ncbi:hypothetical protein JXA48_04800 [Candidatus Woesearchaeota archaeon]|nr:hypothetical protein [Candidatus Woesearchaeota archaeon]